MPKQVWICSKCSSLWESEASAVKCEGRHREPAEFRVISWVPYSNCNHADQMFPKRILLKIKVDGFEGGYDSAVYTLEHIGPIGV